MAAVAVASPKQQFLDGAGMPLAMGFVHTYLAGTNTESTTWQDRDQLVENENPIPLDEYGAATIMLHPALAYRFEVTDAQGTVQPHLGGDNIVGAAGTQILADVEAAKDAALVEIEDAKDAAIVEMDVSVTAAEAAQAAAEAARDSVNTTGKVFTTTALGIAGTVDGQSFSVLNTDLKSWTVYKNNAGVALGIASSYTTAYFDALIDNTYDRDDLSFAFLGENDEGVLYGNEAGEVLDVNGTNLSQAATTFNSVIELDDSYVESGMAWPWLGENDEDLGGIDDDGNLRLRDSVGAVRKALDVFAPYDQYRRDVWGIRAMAWFGDSLTQNGYAATSPPSLLAVKTGWPVANRGVSAFNAERIAVSQGGLVSLLTFPSNTIPASGPVTVSTYTHPIRGDLAPTSITGYLQFGGTTIPGTITWTGTSGGLDIYTFTRTTAGAATEVDPKTPFIVDQFDDDYKLQIWWAGRNGFAADPTGATLISYYKRMRDMLKPSQKRYLILGIINGAGEGIGTTAYNQITANNEALAQEFPDNFINAQKLLVRNYNPGLPQDVIDRAADIVPTSLRIDPLHLNGSGNTVIVDQAVYPFINTLKGWLQ